MVSQGTGEGGTSPPKPMPEVNGVDRSKTAGLGKVDADGVGSGEAVGSGAVEVGG